MESRDLVSCQVFKYWYAAFFKSALTMGGWGKNAGKTSAGKDKKGYSKGGEDWWGSGKGDAWDNASVWSASGGKGWSADGGKSANADGSKGGTEEEYKKRYDLRRLSKDLLPKRYLRTVPDGNANAIVGGTEALAFEFFRQCVSADTSELDSRAPYGWSMLLSAIKAMHVHSKSLPSHANKPIRDFLTGSKEGEKLLELCDKLNFDRIKSEAGKHQKSFKEALKILQAAQDLIPAMPTCIAEAGGLYLSLVWFYDGLVHANGLRMWAERVPDVDFLKEVIEAWKEEKPTLSTTAKFLANSYSAREKHEKAWQGKNKGKGKSSGTWLNDNSDEENGWQKIAGDESKKKSKSKQKESSSSEKSDSGESKKKRKDKKKHQKSSKQIRKSDDEADSGEAKKAKKADKKNRDSDDEACSREVNNAKKDEKKNRDSDDEAAGLEAKKKAKSSTKKSSSSDKSDTGESKKKKKKKKERRRKSSKTNRDSDDEAGSKENKKSKKDKNRDSDDEAGNRQAKKKKKDDRGPDDEAGNKEGGRDKKSINRASDDDAGSQEARKKKDEKQDLEEISPLDEIDKEPPNVES